MSSEQPEDHEESRPLGISLLIGLYAFFFLVGATTFGNPFPFFGGIFTDGGAKFLVFVDSLACLYLIFGIIQRQRITWYFLIVYNLAQILNIIVNLCLLTSFRLQEVLGQPVNSESLAINNIAAALALLLLTQYIFRHQDYFSNRSRYLF